MIEIVLYFIGYTIGVTLQTAAFLLICGALFFGARGCFYLYARLTLSPTHFAAWRENFRN